MAQHPNQEASKPTVHAENSPASAVAGNSTLACIVTYPCNFHVAVDTNGNSTLTSPCCPVYVPVAADTNVFHKSGYMPLLIEGKGLIVSSSECVYTCAG